MSSRAWAYVYAILIVGAVLIGLAAARYDPARPQWTTFLLLTALATIAQLFKAEAPNHQLYSATLVFTFAGVLLLQPLLFVLLVIVSHLIGWAKERVINSPHLRNWYLQPFNISIHIIAGLTSLWVFSLLYKEPVWSLTWAFVPAVFLASVVYDAINHLAIGIAISIARNIPLRESGILDVENLATDLVLLLMGGTVSAVWTSSPLLVLPVLAPLLLIYQSLKVPQLKRAASMDEKTGLWNAHHFAKLFMAEIERAKRFNHPLTFIMADLDLLRDINNSYGHLAGDIVLAGMGQIIHDNLRDYDIAGRFGGEEFGIALPETGIQEARAIAERIRETVQAARFQVTTSSTPIRATMSFGIASLTENSFTATELIHEADVAMYQAKLKGRNCVVCASEVPHSARLERLPLEERFGAYVVSSFQVEQAKEPPYGAAGRAARNLSRNGAAAGSVIQYPRSLLLLFLSVVIGGGIILSIAGFLLGNPVDWGAIALFSVLAVLAEWSQVNLGGATASVSVGVHFAAALIGGLPGVASAGLAVSLTHYVRRRPRAYKTVFNWATHVLAGSIPVLVLSSLALGLEPANLPWLIFPMTLAGLAYYGLDTLLIAAAIGLSTRASILSTWRDHFQWLAPQYVTLCITGLVFAVAFTSMGLWGALVFAFPVLMMRYTQEEHAQRTEASIRELSRMNEELGLANQEILAANATIRTLNDGLFVTLARMIDARDPYVSGHSAEVSRYATAIAVEIGLAPERVEQVRQAALLHDMGKIGVSEQVLNKPERLDAKEYEYVKTHAALGAELLQTCPSLRHLAPFIRHHHECWDGSGYPDGLRMEQIPLEARILALCDAVESMASNRPYHPGMRRDAIVDEVKRCVKTQFDPQVAAAFIRLIEREGEQLIVNSSRDKPKEEH